MKSGVGEKKTCRTCIHFEYALIEKQFIHFGWPKTSMTGYEGNMASDIVQLSNTQSEIKIK